MMEMNNFAEILHNFVLLFPFKMEGFTVENRISFLFIWFWKPNDDYQVQILPPASWQFLLLLEK